MEFQILCAKAIWRMRRDKILFINSIKKSREKVCIITNPKNQPNKKKYVLHGLSVSQMEIGKHN